MLSLLDVFTPAAPVWSTEDLIRYSACSRSTCYRYIKVLQGAGFVTPVAKGSYILGPRIIELDRHVRLCDPVYAAGGPPMRRLAARTGHSALLCVLFSDTVMCVREEIVADAPAGLFSRGQKRPLFSGAASTFPPTNCAACSPNTAKASPPRDSAPTGKVSGRRCGKSARTGTAPAAASSCKASSASPRRCSMARAMCLAAWASPWRPRRSNAPSCPRWPSRSSRRRKMPAQA